MKILRIAAIVVGVVASVALVATGVGAPLGAGLASFFGGISGAIGVSWGAIALGAGLVSMAAGLAAPKPRGTLTGSPVDFKLDPAAPVPYIIGRIQRAGFLTYCAVSL